MMAELPAMPESSESPVSIFDRPPPNLVDLRDALREESRQATNYWHSLVLSAAGAMYMQWVKDHYDLNHRDGRLCECGEDT